MQKQKQKAKCKKQNAKNKLQIAKSKMQKAESKSKKQRAKCKKQRIFFCLLMQQQLRNNEETVTIALLTNLPTGPPH
jgi:hypothetical protein